MMNYLFSIALLMMDGIKYTLEIFFVTIILSMPLGLMLTFFRTSKIKIVKAITGFYVWIMRGTPLLLQLFFFYYGLALVSDNPLFREALTLSRMQAALVAFVLNYAAYFCEIFRGGLLAIDKGQYEAAKVLGLSKKQTLTKIVLPQLLRVTLPSISNESITLVKDTALVTAIGVTEILYFAKVRVNADVNASAYLVAALFYLVMNFVLTKFFAYMEKKYSY